MLQAYIHSRMRRRTADFLQGQRLYLYPAFATMLILCSTQQGKTGERGERAKDSKRSHVQSPGMIAPNVCHRLRGRQVPATSLFMLSNYQRSKHCAIFRLCVSMPGFVFPRSLKPLVVGLSPETLPSQLRPPFRPPIFLFQSRTEFGTSLGLVHRRQPQL